MNIVVFSCNRPLQLKACLDSLSYYCDLSKHTVSIISPDAKYDNDLAKKCEALVYWNDKDGNFNEIIRFVINQALDERSNLMWCVDDLIFHKFFNLSAADTFLKENTDTFGLSLRLGVNSNYYNQFKNISKDSRFYKFPWREVGGDFNYPFDLSCSCYRVSDIKQILKNNDSNIKIPNVLETIGVSAMINGFGNYKYNATFNTESFSSCADLNRVQNLYENPIQGGPEHSPEKLKDAYNNGMRIKWENLFAIEPTVPFIGTYGFDLIKE